MSEGARAVEFLAGGGAMGARVRAHNWSASPLGPVEAWPQALRTALSIALNSGFPAYLVWGPDLISFYNDAYAPILGTKPDALGRSFQEVWPEAWADIGPIASRALAGQASYFEDLPLTLERKGYPEETWCTFSYSPIRDETGGVGGVLCTVLETTDRVREARRLRFLDDLSGRMRGLSDPREVMAVAAERLGCHLAAGRAGYGEVDATGTIFTVERDWTDGAMPGFVGRHHLDDFGPPIIDELRAGRTIRLDDALADPRTAGQGVAAAFAAIGMRAGISAPFMDRGQIAATLYVHQAKPRRWRDDEVALMEEVASRTWEAVRRARAETALRESEARLQAAIDLVGLSPYAWDPRTGALHWDDRLRAMWGVSADAPVDHDMWLSGVHPDDRARVAAAAARSIDPGGDGVYNVEYRVVGLADGVERWVSTRGQTRFEGGQPVWFIGAVREITGDKRAEERLRRSEAYLSAIVQQLPVGVGVFDGAGRLTLDNEAFRRYPTDVLPSRSAEQARRWRAFRGDGSAFPVEDHPGVRALRGEATAPGMEFLHTLADGRELWTRVGAAPLRDGGAVAGAVVTVQDIDQEKRAGAALRESEERFRLFADNATDVLWTMDVAAGEIDYVSPAFERVWGEPARAGLRDLGDWAASVHPDDRPHATAALGRIVREGEVVVQEYRIVRATDGVVRWIRDTMFPIRDEHGRVRWVGGIAQDITRHEGSLVYVVNGDQATRETVTAVLHGAGYDVKTFASPRTFLEAAPALLPGCVVVDTRAPETAGLAIPRELKARGIGLPVIVVGGSRSDVAFAVQAMKAGAADYLEAPCARKALLGAVASALAGIRDVAPRDRAVELARARIAAMSGREREVLDGLLAGGTNKTIARDLGISPRTVEVHRAGVMERLGARTLPEVVIAAIAAGLSTPPTASRPAATG